MAAKTKSPFGPGLMKFLRELSANNKKSWFEANKDRYEKEVREPALEFIRQMAPHLKKISPHMVASDKKVGGSLMRIYRDVRFSKDKSPYKTNVGIQFRHDAGKDVHAPGYYLHIDPEWIFLGAGMWHPDAAALAAVRERIDTDPKAWLKARDGKAFRDHWKIAGDSLKRAPKGYAPDHPMIEDLRRKDHIADLTLKRSDLTKPDLVAATAAQFKRAKPYMAFQMNALGLPF